MILENFLLLFFLGRITVSKEVLSVKWNDEDTGDAIEVMDQLTSSVDEKSVDIEIEIIGSNASPAMECITRELFRISEPFCYCRTYGRGAGYPLNACPDNAPDKSGLICYPKCRDGFIGVGPVCWQDCGKMKTVGIFCVDSNLVETSPDDDQNEVVKIFYDSKDSYKHIFVRKSYGRGAGSPMVCSSQYEKDGALCYDHCDKRYYGVGPVCWQYCPSSQPTACGPGCSLTPNDCTEIIIEMFTALVGASMGILRLKIDRSLIASTTVNLIISAAKSDWISVAGNMSILSNTLAEIILPDVSKNCAAWPIDTLESATKNASFLLTVAAFNDTDILRPFLKIFDIFGIIKAFDHGLCNLRDDSHD